MNKNAKVFVTGHRRMVGSAIVRRLQANVYHHLLTRSHAELDLLDQRAVYALLAAERPDYVFIAAAKVGGIQANNLYRADFLHQNLLIEANLIHGAHLADVQRLMFLGSSCIYPRDCPQPIKEEYLLTGPLEPTNEPYAIAKIAGIKLAESYNRQYGRQYISVMPTNLYGPNDNYDLAFVIATGVQYNVRQFVEFAARELGITLVFSCEGEAEVGTVVSVQGDQARCKAGDVIVKVDPRYFRPTEVETLLGDPTKAKQKLGWVPKITLPELVKEMVEADYSAARRDSLVKLAGFQAYDYNE